MQKRNLSIKSLLTRVDTLRRRHRNLDGQIQKEQQHPSPDFNRINTLKREKLGLRDAIRLTQVMLSRMHTKRTQQPWQGQFHSG